MRPPDGCDFVGAFHIGTDVYLRVRGPNGVTDTRRATEFVPDLRHYFLVWADDLATDAAKAAFVLLCRDGVQVGRTVYRPDYVSRDPYIPGWLRLYLTLPPRYVSKSVKARTRPDEATFLTTMSPAVKLARRLETAGVRTFEADLDPVRRFLTDYTLHFSSTLRYGCLDIETDDSTGRPVAEVIGNVRILSCAVRDCADKSDLYCRTAADDDASEYALLAALLALLERFDVVYAWNGSVFDWPFIFLRAHYYGLSAAIPPIIYWDSLASFKKHHAWDAESKAGYSLENVSRALLHEGKVGRDLPVKTLWSQFPEELRTYNIRDVDLTERIEEKTGYVAADMALNRLANCTPDTGYVSFRVDGLALAEGYGRGTHFRTKFMRPDGDEEEKFHGAFVLAPVVGVHDDVGNFDFASLYPSVFASWNISTDTYLRPAEAERLKLADPAAVVRCPVVQLDDGTSVGGSYFAAGRPGIIPSVYERVAVERKKWKKLAATRVPNSPEYLADRRMEYAYKTLGLSMYGVMGSVHSRYYNRDVAEAVTLTAQFLIRATMKLAERLGYLPIYGDTDSLFIRIPQSDVGGFLAESRKLYAAAAVMFGCPRALIELEYEQYFRRLVLVGKKRYFGRLVVQKERACDVLEVKGLELRRSDGVAAVRKLQTDLVEGLALGTWDARRVVDWAIAVRERLFSGGFGVDDLKLTGGIQKPLDEYRAKTPPPHVVVAKRMREAGRDVYLGTKIAYIIVDGLRRAEYPAYEAVEEWSGWYDPVAYWAKRIWPALARVCKVAVPEQDWSVFDKVWYPKLKNKLQVCRVKSTGSVASWADYSAFVPPVSAIGKR